MIPTLAFDDDRNKTGSKSMTKMIEAKGVVKTIGKKKILKGISLQVAPATIFGLLGPNGAGKTTFIKSLLHLTAINAGDITINGIPHHQEICRQNLSYLPEKFSFFPYYSVKGTLLFFGQMNGNAKVSAKQAKIEREKNAEFCLEKLNLKSIAEQKLKTLSKGQLQRVGLAKLLMGDNHLLVLDEPFSGLDPLGMKDLKNLLLELKQMGKTIFINSHLLSEVEQICDDVAILNEGEIAAQGNIKMLLKNTKLEDFFYNTVKGSSEAWE